MTIIFFTFHYHSFLSMNNVPSYVPGTFIAIVVAILSFITYAIKQASPGKKNLTPSISVTILLAWVFLVSVLTFNSFFQNYSLPPRLLFFLLVPTGFITILFLRPKSRKFLQDMPLTTLHYIHIVRVPVEMVLWWLSVWLLIPKEMTFEGANLDIISGISAPFAAVFMVGSRSKNRVGGVIWNLLSLGLLINIVARAIRFSPYYFTPENTEIGNTGIFYFPYILLPTFVVPVILFAHLVSLYQLIFKKDQLQF